MSRTILKKLRNLDSKVESFMEGRFFFHLAGVWGRSPRKLGLGAAPNEAQEQIKPLDAIWQARYVRRRRKFFEFVEQIKPLDAIWKAH